ncbi:MAG: excinuclease ABC subunit UvrC [Bacteroidetes bacterium]|nr:excinuclease ABC subunit UvrC [Bacteroidota bacterium]
MKEALETALQNLPDNPGVYQFKDDTGKVLYVGKAKNLKNRVKSYFTGKNPSYRIELMVSKAADVEFIVTTSEIEALVLENNLIKKLKPRYNINLKDDKTYPFIKVTAEQFPRIYPTRKVYKDGSQYFGPYTDVKSMRAALRMITQIFKIRSCKLPLTTESIQNSKYKVCLDYHIKKCDGPCVGYQSLAEYNLMVNQVIKLLKGRIDDLIRDFKSSMSEAAANLEFEKAADYRDRLEKIQAFSEKQKIVSEDEVDRDIIAIANEAKDAACSVLNIRAGKLIGKKEFHLQNASEGDLTEIYAAFIKQFYNDFIDIPSELITGVEPAELEEITSLLQYRSGKKIRIFTPKRGDLKSLVEMSGENAALQLKEIQLQKVKKEGNIPFTLAALQRDLYLKKIPRHIECFDISNLQGTDTVASMVVFVDGKPKKSLYRKFAIKTVSGPDDFASMEEVITRRYSRLIKEKEQLPDLIMVDGGKGQLSTAVYALRLLGLKNFEIIGLAKRLEEVFLPKDPDPVIIPKTSSALKLLQQVRDEAHRFAITFHRLKRSKRTFTTQLLEIDGIGEKLATRLLSELGSVKEIEKASLDSLARVVGDKKAGLVYNYFRETK